MGAALNDLKAITAQKSPLQDEMAARSRGLMQQTNAPRREILSQLTEALRTGGVGAKIPSIQRAVESSNQQNSQALGQTAEQLAAKNIGGTAGARIMAGQRLAGAQQTSQIPTTMAQQVIAQFMPFLSQVQGLGFGGLSQAGQAQQQQEQFNTAQRNAAIQGGGLFGGSKILGLV